MKLMFGPRELELGGPYLDRLAEVDDTRDFPTLRRRLADDGYLLLRGLHDPERVRAARAGLLANLDRNEQLDRSRPLDEAAVAPGAGGQFYGGRKEISQSESFLALVEAPELLEWFSLLFEAPALTFDYKWIRAVAPGANTGAHFDIVYMGRGTHNLLTLWTPLGDCPFELGPLAILADSPRLEKVKATYGQLDVDRDRVEGGHLSRDPVELVDKYGGRWRTTELAAGDALLFGMFTLHGSLTNTSERFRLSCDVRFQRADEPVDERWVGENPKAHYAWHAGEQVPMAVMRERWGV